MTDLRTAAQQALEAICAAKLCEFNSMSSRHEMVRLMDEAITALRAALVEPVQEPVAMDWLHKWANQDDGEPETQWHEGYEAARRVVQIHLTAPPQRKPLTTETFYGLFVRSGLDAYRQKDFVVQTEYDRRVEAFARAIERAHGITS